MGDLQSLPSGETRVRRPPHYHQRHRQVEEAGPERRDYRYREYERRDGEEDVGHPHQRLVEDPTVEPGEGAYGEPQYHRESDDDEAYRDRVGRGREDPAELVPS